MIMIPAEDHHIEELFSDLRETDKEVLERMAGLDQAREAVEAMIKQFPTLVFITDGGKVAALWVLVIKWEGVGEILSYTTNEVEKNTVGFFKACLRGIATAQEFYGLNRIQANVWAEYQRSINWLKRLGFVEEGTRRNYWPNKLDAVSMGRIY